MYLRLQHTSQSVSSVSRQSNALETMGWAGPGPDGATHAEQAGQQLAAFKAFLSSGVLAPCERASECTIDDAVNKWMDDNFGPGLTSDAKVARVLMRCVLEAAVDNGEPSATEISKQIDRCSKLLGKCTSAPEQPVRVCKQAGLLYEVQSFCGDRLWPRGLLKKLFYILYVSDIVSEDAYGVWREDVSDETPGKDKALFEVGDQRRRTRRRTRGAVLFSRFSGRGRVCPRAPLLTLAPLAPLLWLLVCR
jgi:hypothetical protein